MHERNDIFIVSSKAIDTRGLRSLSHRANARKKVFLNSREFDDNAFNTRCMQNLETATARKPASIKAFSRFAAKRFRSTSVGYCIKSVTERVEGRTHAQFDSPWSFADSFFSASSRLFVLRHLGKAEHARKRPRRPVRITMGLPHFSHFSSVGSGGALGLDGLPSTLRVNLQSGYSVSYTHLTLPTN